MLAHPHRAEELRARAQLLRKDRLLDSADLMDLAAIDIEETHAEIGKLREMLAGEPGKWSFDTLLWVGRRLLTEHYPADIFNGSSGDSGPEYVVALRKALDRCDDVIRNRS